MAMMGFSSILISSYWWYLPRRSRTAAVCSSVSGSRSSALPRTITKASSLQSSVYRSAIRATWGFSRMFLTRLRWIRARLSASRRGRCRSKTAPGSSTRARRAGSPPRRRSRGGPPSGARERQPAPHLVRWKLPSSRYRVADARDDFGGEQAHVCERLFVGDARKAAPEAEVVVWRLLMQPDQASRDLLRRADEVPLPGQVLLADRLRRRLVPVGAPLGVARALVGDGRGDDLPGPSGILVYESHAGGHIWELFFGAPVPLERRQEFPVRLAESPTAGRGEKAIGEARGPVYGRVRKGADVHGEPVFRAWPERQVLKAPALAFVARPSSLDGVTDHFDPLLEERGSVSPLEAERLELVLHVALADAEHEPPAGDEIDHRRILRHPQRMVHRQQEHVRPDGHGRGSGRYRGGDHEG